MNEIEKAIKGARAAQANRIYGSFIQDETVAEENIAKAEETDIEEGEENPFAKAAEEDEDADDDEEVGGGEEVETTEKSDIMNALSGHDSIKVSKTGAEIKEQVNNVVLPKLNSELAVKKNEALEVLKNCGSAPLTDPYQHWSSDIKIDCGHKIYDWNETYFSEEKGVFGSTLSAEDAVAKKGNRPDNRVQAEARSNYNRIVSDICNISVDIKACEIMNSLKDASAYELSPRQFTSLQF